VSAGAEAYQLVAIVQIGMALEIFPFEARDV
jgi:hypothetical protein